MLFHIFNSQKERIDYGGSDFIEIQFCKLPFNTKSDDITYLDNINHWQNDSLYVADEEMFYKEYCCIFDTLDIFGINYYSAKLIDTIIEKLGATKPVEYDILLKWLNKAKTYNGFYILGV